MTDLETKIEKLEKKKKQIQSEIESLQKSRRLEVSNILEKMDLKDYDVPTIAGALLWVLNENHDTKTREAWRVMGSKFCAKNRRSKIKNTHPLEKKKAA